MDGEKAILSRLSAAGLHLEVSGNTLSVSPRAALTDETRDLIRTHKAALVSLLSQAPDPDTPRARWLVTLPSGDCFTSRQTPPATLAEMRSWYPDALIEPEADFEPPAPARVMEQAPVSPLQSPRVSCAACRHYQANPRGWSGLGRCLVDAPASREPGSLWPASIVLCNVFAPIEVNHE